MINICPHCGSWLEFVLIDGIATCQKCEKIFDSSDKYIILYYYWFIKYKKIDNIELIDFGDKLSDDVLDFINYNIIKNKICYSELIKILN